MSYGLLFALSGAVPTGDSIVIGHDKGKQCSA
jgi:hypothetical protein